MFVFTILIFNREICEIADFQATFWAFYLFILFKFINNSITFWAFKNLVTHHDTHHTYALSTICQGPRSLGFSCPRDQFNYCTGTIYLVLALAVNRRKG